MFNRFHKYSSPKYFYDASHRVSWWSAVICIILLLAGLYGGLVYAPPDYQQGDGFRIIYIHVPSAWMSLFIYMIMAGAGAIGLIWHVKIAEVVARSSAPLGASFTFLVP